MIMQYSISNLLNFLLLVFIVSEELRSATDATEVLFGVRDYSGSKSERMCNKYTTEACNGKLSIPKVTNVTYTPSFAVGGRLSLAKEYPHMALLGYIGGIKTEWSCGGSLISKNYVLSAAHCTSSERGHPGIIRLGELDLASTKDDARTVDYTIIEIVVHPDYHRPVLYNDIALIRFQGIAAFTDYIRPICLNSFDDFGTKNVTAVGWGSTGYGEKGSDELLSVDLDVQESADCNSLYKGKDLPNGFNQSTQICVGYAAGGKDTCQGDSGGPLQTLNKLAGCSKIYKQVGIVSFGEGCAFPNTPAVYTRVSYYIPWIESIVWK